MSTRLGCLFGCLFVWYFHQWTTKHSPILSVGLHFVGFGVLHLYNNTLLHNHKLLELTYTRRLSPEGNLSFAHNGSIHPTPVFKIRKPESALAKVNIQSFLRHLQARKITIQHATSKIENSGLSVLGVFTIPATGSWTGNHFLQGGYCSRSFPPGFSARWNRSTGFKVCENCDQFTWNSWRDN